MTNNLLLQDLIKVYDDVLPPENCKQLINFFESQEKIQRSSSIAHFSEVNLNLSTNDLNVVKTLSSLQVALFNQYQSELPQKFTIPDVKAFEEFRIKCYDVNDIFDWHIDVADTQSSKRYLAFLWYLSDVPDNSGKTVFFDSLSVKPKVGSVVVFPPMWMFPHKGDIVTSRKYIMSSYAHYQ